MIIHMPRTKISTKYQLVIPKEIRRRMKLTQGMIVNVELIDERYALLSKQTSNHTKTLTGLGKNIWKKLGGTEKYLRDERTAWGK